MTSRSIDGRPSGVSWVWKVRLRMIRLPVVVGMRTESAMKPMRPTSGMTSSRARAAPGARENDVVEHRARLAQVLGAGGGDGVEHALGVGRRVHGAHAGGQHVAGDVAIEQRPHHVREGGRGARRRRHQYVAAGVELVLVDAVDQHDRVGWQALLAPALEGSAQHHDLGACFQVAAQGASGRVGRRGRVLEDAGGVDHQPHAVLAPGDVAGVAGRAQYPHLLAVDAQQARGLVEHFDAGPPCVPVQEAMHRAVRAVLGEVLGHG